MEKLVFILYIIYCSIIKYFLVTLLFRLTVFTDSLPDFETQIYNPDVSDDEEIIPDTSTLYQNQMMDPHLQNFDNNDSSDEEVDFYKQFIIFG